MRTLLVILAAVAVCLAIDGATTPYNFSPATKAYSSQVNANFDSLRIPLNKMKDTLNLKMVRYAKVYRNHDSTFQWMNIDTIKGPVWTDTLRVDTVRVGRGLSVAGPLMGSTGSFTSWLYTADSVLADAGIVTLGPVKGATGKFTSAVTVDSLKSTKGINATTGTFSGTVTVDSLKSTKGISYAGAGINTTNGIFSGKVTATDSMRTNGSMRAATGTFTSTLTVDSLKSTKGINATTGTFSGTVTVDSLKSTKGIVGTIGTFDKLIAAAVDTGSWTYTAYGFSGAVQGNVKYAIIGKTVTLSFESGYGTSNSDTMGLSDLPSAVRPDTEGRYFSIPLVDSGTVVSGVIDFGSTGVVRIYKYSGVFATSGTKGITPFSITYIKNY